VNDDDTILLTASEKLFGIDDMNSEITGWLILSYFANNDLTHLGI
jgi:hypothetical protein